jgi:hypothetical protein
MSKNILVYPGQKTERVSLQNVLRESHEAARAARFVEIETRKKNGAPLDDKTPWSTVKNLVAAAVDASAALDSTKVNDLARAIASATDGNALVEMPEYVASDDIDGIEVVLVMPSDEQKRDWTARRLTHWRSYKEALLVNDIIKLRAADEQITRVNEESVASCIDEIHGIEGMRASVKESIPGLRLVGLLNHFVTAVQHFVELDPKKALRCGQPQPST